MLHVACCLLLAACCLLRAAMLRAAGMHQPDESEFSAVVAFINAHTS
jgi:hypothetical protein